MADINLAALTDIACEAGLITLSHRANGVEVDRKDDNSPVTAADKAAEAAIIAGLSAAYPDVPVLAEEAASEGKIPDLGERFFLVDPLDGTKEFIGDSGEFTVNIALIENGAPVMGVVYAPALGALYRGDIKAGAERLSVSENGEMGPPSPIHVRTCGANDMVAIASRSHRSPETNDFLEEMGISDTVSAGSSLKFCRVAEGAADIYPRFGRTMEWDTGAGQAVLEAAGGKVVTHPEGDPLAYGKESRGYDNPYFIAYGKK